MPYIHKFPASNNDFATGCSAIALQLNPQCNSQTLSYLLYLSSILLNKSLK